PYVTGNVREHCPGGCRPPGATQNVGLLPRGLAKRPLYSTFTSASTIRITPITTSRWMAPNVTFTASHSTSQAMMNTIPSSERTAFIDSYPGYGHASPEKACGGNGFRTLGGIGTGPLASGCRRRVATSSARTPGQLHGQETRRLLTLPTCESCAT